MSKAEELLDGLSGDDIALYTADPSTEGHIVVGSDRFITVPDELKRIAVQHDHNIETVTFDCPRYWDGIDMSTMHICVNYKAADNSVSSYIVDNVTIDEVDENIMHFTWTISGNVTKTVGRIAFLVCVKKLDENGDETIHWNSELNTDMYVTAGLECAAILPELYPDIMLQLLDRMDACEAVTSPESILSFVDKYITENHEVVDESVNKVLTPEVITDEVEKLVTPEVIEEQFNKYAEDNPFAVEVDKTLSVPDMAADAAVTGNAIKSVKKYLGLSKNLLVPSSNYEDYATMGAMGMGMSIKGVTFRVNEDYSITVDGTAMNNEEVYFDLFHVVVPAGVDYFGGECILTGCPEGGSEDTYYIQFFDAYSAAEAFDTGEGVNFTAPVYTDHETTISAAIIIRPGVTVNNLTFRPMIRLASEKDSMYEPYIEKTKLEVMEEEINEEISDIKKHLGMGKNLIIPSGDKTGTYQGVTYTTNADGSITLNGISTVSSASYGSFEIGRYIVPGEVDTLGECILTGCPEGGHFSSGNPYDPTTYALRVEHCIEGQQKDSYDEGEGVSFTPYHFANNGLDGIYKVWIVFGPGQSFDNLTFYPMIRLASEMDDTYEPYIGPDRVRELERDVSAIERALLSGAIFTNGDFDFLGSVAANGIGVNMANDPLGRTDARYHIQHIPVNNDFEVVQYARCMNIGGNLYTRARKNDRSWSAWSRLATDVDIHNILGRLGDIADNEISVVTDANSIINTSFKIATSSSTNVKHTDGFLFTLAAHGGNCVIQINIPFNANVIYIRSCWYGTWYPWRLITTTSAT